MKRSNLLSALLLKANLPSGQTIAETKADSEAAWQHRKQEIRREAFYYQTGRRLAECVP